MALPASAGLVPAALARLVGLVATIQAAFALGVRDLRPADVGSAEVRCGERSLYESFTAVEAAAGLPQEV